MRLARGLFDEELVLWRAARVRARVHNQLPVVAQDALAPPQRVLDQFCRREVLVYVRGLDLIGNGKYR